MNDKILIVEDARFARKILINALETGNYRNVVEASNAKEAEELFTRENPDLVILDISLPDNDDLTLLSRLLEINPSAKIIMCSALGQNLIMKNALEIGAKDYILKPYSTKSLIEAIKKQLAN